MMFILNSIERKQSALSLVISLVIGVYFLLNNVSADGGEVIKILKDVPDLVIDALKHNHATYLANVWATMGFLIIAIGWVISSDKAREFLIGSDTSRRVCLNTIAIFMIFHSIILFDMVFESERILSNIKIAIPGAQYYVISTNHAVSSSIVDGVFLFCYGY